MTQLDLKNAPAEESDFPELTEFLDEQRRRKKRGLGVALGIAAICALAGVGGGLFCLRAANPSLTAIAASASLLGAGLLGFIRICLSWFTRIDDRPLPYGKEGRDLEKKLLG